MGDIKKNVLLGILFTVLFSFSAFVFIPIAVEVNDPQGVTPATWPRFVSLFIGVMALILTYISAMKLKKENETSDETAEKIVWGKFSLTTMCLISFYFLVDLLGIVLASMIIFICFSRICGKCNWKVTIFLAIIIPLVLYFFFTRLAHVPMPLGIFYDYL